MTISVITSSVRTRPANYPPGYQVAKPKPKNPICGKEEVRR